MNGKVYKKYFRITKVRSRQRVKPAAVQPIVMLTAPWAGKEKNEKSIFIFLFIFYFFKSFCEYENFNK